MWIILIIEHISITNIIYNFKIATVYLKYKTKQNKRSFTGCNYLIRGNFLNNIIRYTSPRSYHFPIFFIWWSSNSYLTSDFKHYWGGCFSRVFIFCMKVKVITHRKTLKIKITINKRIFYRKSTFGFNTKRRCHTFFLLAVQR